MPTTQDTRIAVDLITTFFTDFDAQVRACFMHRDAFLEHLIQCEMPRLRQDLLGKRNSDKVKTYIADALHRLGGTKSLSSKHYSFNIQKETADELRELEHEHNLVRAALFNRLIALSCGQASLFEALDLPLMLQGSGRHREKQVGLQPELAELMADPFYLIRFECLRIHGCGIHALKFPMQWVGLSLYLPDEYLPEIGEPQFQLGLDTHLRQT